MNNEDEQYLLSAFEDAEDKLKGMSDEQLKKVCKTVVRFMEYAPTFTKSILLIAHAYNKKIGDQI